MADTDTTTEPSDTAPVTEPTATEPPTDPKPSAPQAETTDVDWKAAARKHEKEAKATKAELDKLRKAAMSDQEKAVAEAEERGRKEATTEAATLLASARIEAALTGVVPDPADVVEELNLARYITEDGKVDSEAVAKLREKYVALAAPSGKPAIPGVPAGARTDAGVRQLTREEIKSMTPEQISEARSKGQFADLMKSGKS